MGRVTKLSGDQREDVALYAQQLARWAEQPLIPAQREEVARLQAQITKLGEVTAAIISLAEKLKPRTIDPLLEKRDIEVGLEFLPPRRRA